MTPLPLDKAAEVFFPHGVASERAMYDAARKYVATYAAQRAACSLTGQTPPAADLEKLKAANAIIDRFQTKLADGYVYIIRQRNKVKIGFSKQPDIRLKSLSMASGEELSFAALVPGSLDHETALHARFAKYRTIGEWFMVQGELRQFMRSPEKNLRKAIDGP